MDPRETDDSPALWSGRPAWSHFAFLFIFVAILGVRGAVAFRMGSWQAGLFHLVAVLLLTGLGVFLRQTAHYRLTRMAVYRSKGLLGKGEKKIPISTIASVDEQQGPLDRLLGSGEILLHLKDGRSERLSGVKDPEVVSRKIRAIL